MKVNDIDWILPSVNGRGGLAVSNVRFFEGDNLEKQNIGAIVSVFGEKDLILPQNIKHLRILISDHPKENISIFFQSSYIFIDSNLKKTNVVVHCQAGVSRSVSLVMAYLIRKERLSYEAAFEKVKQKRPVANPNKGFVKQLKQFAKEISEIPPEIKESPCRLF